MKKHTFKSFSFQPLINNIIEKLYFKEPTKIQQKAIPAIIKGRNIIAESHTGSGKTHAYLFPLLNRLDPSVDKVQIVITLPTRELAQQIYDDIREMTLMGEKESVWRTRLLTGGTDRKQMIARLKTPPHIVVGTPGRILDLILDNHLSIYSANAFVIDEADLMYELGLFETIDQLLVRARENIQQLAFSATIPQPLEHLLKKYMANALSIEVSGQLTPEQLEHRLIPLYHRKPAEVIYELSKTFHPYLAIVFTNGQDEAIQLAKQLQTYGLDTGLLHGGLSQRERRRTLRQIEQLHYEYVVATDLVSRGIDIEGVSHVINAALPKEVDFYVHRVGRTARAGLEGMAISLFTDDDIPLIHKLERRNVSFLFSDVKGDELIDVNRPIAKPQKYQKNKHRKYRRQSKKNRRN